MMLKLKIGQNCMMIERTNWGSESKSHKGQKSKDGELHICDGRDLEVEREIKVVRRQSIQER